jgi:iron complex outermembrane receptor protein
MAKYHRSQLLSYACACALGLAANHAFAQTTAQSGPAKPATETVSLEEVVVTGSFISGTPEDTALPVEVISEEELDNLGRPSNLDLLKSISEVGESFGEANRFNGAPVGAASINLRNIGSRFTTVIFNGRRFPEQYSVLTGRFNNINWIPNSAIGRVEILKEGGAATYGADAVGGVVNYITRRNVDGLEVNVDYRHIKDSDGDYNADAIWGKTFENGGNVMLVAGYQHRSVLSALDRDWAQKHYLEQRTSISAAGSPGSYIFMSTGGTTPTGAISPTILTPALTRYNGERQMSAGGTVRDPSCTQLGGFAGWNSTPSPVCYMQGSNFEQLVSESDSYQLYGEANFTLMDSVKLHIEGLYYQLDAPTITNSPSDAPGSFPLIRDVNGNPTSARQQFGTGLTALPTYFVSGQNPAVSDFLNNRFLNSDGTTPAYSLDARNAIINNGKVALVTGIWRPFALGGHPLDGTNTYQHNNTKMYRLTTDLTGDMPKFLGTDLEWNAAVTYSRTIYTVSATDMLVDRMQDALNGRGGPNCTGAAGSPGCLWFNPFGTAIERSPYNGAVNSNYVPSLANSAELINWLTVPINLRREYDNYIVDALVRGSLGRGLPWVDKEISVAGGVQFRYSDEHFMLDDLSNRDLNPCPTIGYTGCPEGQQTGVLFNARANGVLGTIRPSKRYYPVGAAYAEIQMPLMDNPTWGTLNWQLAGRYEKFISDVTDRDNSVAVPATAIKWQPLDWLAVRSSWGKTFSQVNPPKNDGPTVTTTSNNTAFGGINYTSQNFDNVDVQPEKGSYFSGGLIFQTANFSATVDYFDVRVDDYSRTITANNVLRALIGEGANGTDSTTPLLCDSPLFNAVPGFNGQAFVVMPGGGACNPGDTLNDLSGGTINFFGGVGQVNAGELKTTGIDFSTRYRFDEVFGGSLTPSIDLTYNLEYELEDTLLAGVKVANGYDGIGYANSSTGRLGFSVPQYRGTFSVAFNRGAHTINVQVRYLPTVKQDNDDLFTAVAASNANIGNASGFTTTGAGASFACIVPGSPTGLTSNLGNIPAGAGTGEFGVSPGGGLNQNGSASSARGYCGGQNTAVLSGKTIAASTNIDLNYLVNLENDVTVSLNLFNLTDQDPSFDRGIVPYNSGYGSPLGRTIRFALRKKF